MFLGANREQNNNFLASLSDRKKFWYGTFMWALLFFAYMVFCLNWLIMSNLESGWSKYYDLGSSQKGLQSVNYSLLFARGFAMVWVALIMAKISHKRAVVVSLFLNMASMLLPFSPNFGMFIAGRMLMACGGTMSIILIQPILSRFFNLRQKGIFSLFSSFAYVLGALTANLIFLNKDVSEYLNEKWQVVSFLSASLSVIPFYIYWVFGRDFSTSDGLRNEAEHRELPQNTYGGIIREKSCWFWIFWYSFLLVASVSVSNTVPVIIKQINPSLVSHNIGVDWKSMYIIIFYLGCFFGFFLGRWNKTQYRRKPFVVMCCFLGLFFWSIIILTAAFVKTYLTFATVVIYGAAFLFAFFAMGVQTVILYIPHEYPENNSAKRITIFFSYLWGIGYMVYGIYSVIISSAMDIRDYGAPIAAVLISILIALFGVFALLIKEPRPEWKMHPWDRGGSKLLSEQKMGH